MKHHFFLLLLLPLGLCFLGCGGDQSYVGGKVSFSDGKPLHLGRVCFVSEKGNYSCKIQPDGTFRMGSRNDGDGIPPGVYKVSIEQASVPSATELGPDGRWPPPTPLVTKKFTDPKNSGIVCDTSQGRTFNITVEPPTQEELDAIKAAFEMGQ